MVWLTVFGIFNVRTDADVCDSTRRLYGHRKRISAGSGIYEKNPLPHLGLEPASVLHLAFRSDAVPTELSPPLYIFGFRNSSYLCAIECHSWGAIIARRSALPLIRNRYRLY